MTAATVARRSGGPVTEAAGGSHPRHDMTRPLGTSLPLFVCAALLAAVPACNLDLDELIDEAQTAGDTEGDDGDTDGDDDGGDTKNADDPGDDPAGTEGGEDPGADGGADSSGGGDDEPVSGDADALLGLWVGTLDDVAFAYEFHDDGTYLQAVYLEIDDGGCLVTDTEYYAGNYTVDGDALSLQPLQGEQHVDQCGEVTDSTELIDPAVWSWSLQTDDAGEQLVLAADDLVIVLAPGDAAQG